MAVADLHGAQAGYVAAGQGPAFWIARATDLFTRIETDLTSLRSATASTDAATHYDAALVALRDLKGIDARARSDAMGDRRFEASDRVFTDSREANERLAAELGAARTSEQAAAAANLTRISKFRLIMNGVAMAFLLAVAAFFWRARPVESAPADAGITSIRPDLPLRLNVPATPAAPSAPPPPLRPPSPGRRQSRPPPRRAPSTCATPRSSASISRASSTAGTCRRCFSARPPCSTPRASFCG